VPPDHTRTFIVRVNEVVSPDDGLGRAGWSAFGVIMLGLGTLWMVIFASVPVLLFMGLIWMAVSLLLTVAGFREARQRQRPRAGSNR
jgi:hypothetical protein